MSNGFTGTNTEKIDALIQAFIAFRAEQRATSKLVAWVVGVGVGVGVPIILGLSTFLVTQAFRTDARLGQVEVRLAAVESRLGALEGRLGRIESRLGGEGRP